MKLHLLLLPLLLSFSCVFGETIPKNATIIDPTIFEKTFPNTTLEDLSITYPIFRAYQYKDNTGNYYCLLTEDQKLKNNEETQSENNEKIKAILLKKVGDNFQKIWEINDFINSEEKSIWFWTKYTDFIKVKENYVIPIIVYGSAGYNGYGDGRMKIIIYNKNKKIAIRHQNAMLDAERILRIDASFYTLPKVIQNTVIEKMKKMSENEHCNFPYYWEEAMKKKKLIVN